MPQDYMENYDGGNDPIDEIDHKNGSRSDNRFCNLRQATLSQNRHNCGLRRNNTSGFRCVFRYEYGFRAIFEKDKKKIDLGCFRTAEEAYQKYCDTVGKYVPDFVTVAQ